MAVVVQAKMCQCIQLRSDRLGSLLSLQQALCLAHPRKRHIGDCAGLTLSRAWLPDSVIVRALTVASDSVSRGTPGPGPLVWRLFEMLWSHEEEVWLLTSSREQERSESLPHLR